MRVMASRPRLMIHLEYVWTGFQRLSRCRPLGPAGVGSIPWTAVDQYCSRYDIEGAEYEYFVGLIEALDEVYLDHQPKPDKPGSNRRGAGK